MHNVAFCHLIEKFLGPSGYLVNRNNALGGLDVIAFSTMGGAQPKMPYSYLLQGQSEPTKAILVGGDLRTIETIRAFWQLSLEELDSKPLAIWLNLTNVFYADTKLAACLVAIIRRAQEHDTSVYIVGSDAVQDVLKLCKVPPLQLFTKVA